MAIVTAAARGIGAAVVDALAGVGWTVVALDRCADLEGVDYPMSHPADLEALAARRPGQVQAVIADVGTRRRSRLSYRPRSTTTVAWTRLWHPPR